MKTRFWSTGAKVAVVGAALTLGLAACSSGSSSGSSSSGGSASGDAIGVSLITRTTPTRSSSRCRSRRRPADQQGVKLTLAAGNPMEMSRTGAGDRECDLSGQKGILITPNGPGVNSAIDKARAAASM